LASNLIEKHTVFDIEPEDKAKKKQRKQELFPRTLTLAQSLT
jgi:hypothetical protein